MKEWIATFQQGVEKQTIPSLKVNFNNVFCYYFNISHTHKNKIPDNYIRRKSPVNGHITPELKEYEDKILTLRNK